MKKSNKQAKFNSPFFSGGASDSDLVNVKIEAPFYDDPPPTESVNSQWKIMKQFDKNSLLNLENG